MFDFGNATNPPAPPGLYVAQNGDDNNPGTADKPMRHFDRAIAAAGPDGTVYLSGRYDDERIVINASGAADHRVTLRPDPANRGYVDGAHSNPSGTWNTDNLILVAGNDLIWDGIEVVNSPWNGLNVGGDRVTVRNTKIHEIYIDALTSGGDDVVFEDNQIDRAELCNENNKASSGDVIPGAGIDSRFNSNKNARIKNWIVQRNKVSNTWGGNITALEVDNFQILDNDVSPPTKSGIGVDNASNGVIERNYVHDGPQTSFSFGSIDYPYGTNAPPHDITFRNNIVHRAGDVIFLTLTNGENKYYDIHFVANTFVGSDLNFNPAAAAPVGCDFVDNIFMGGKFTIADGGWRVDSNDWFNVNGGPPAADAHAHTFDPQFSDETALGADGLKLKSTSQIIHAGTPFTGLDADYFGTKRPNPPSIGAYEPPP